MRLINKSAPTAIIILLQLIGACYSLTTASSRTFNRFIHHYEIYTLTIEDCRIMCHERSRGMLQLINKVDHGRCRIFFHSFIHIDDYWNKTESKECMFEFREKIGQDRSITNYVIGDGGKCVRNDKYPCQKYTCNCNENYYMNGENILIKENYKDHVKEHFRCCGVN